MSTNHYMNLTHDYRKTNALVAFVVVFSVLGYPIQAAIPAYFNVDSTLFNSGIRALVTLVSIFIIGEQCASGKLVINRYAVPFVLFWLMYLVRLFVDLQIKEVTYAYDRFTPFFIYSMAIGGCLIPSIAVFLSTKKLDLNYIYKWIYVGSFVGNLLIFVLMLYQNDISSWAGIFAGRLVIYGYDDNGARGVINPISVSFYGSILFLISLVDLKIKSSEYQNNRIIFNLLKLIGVILGLTNLFAGASRGPFLSTLLLMILLLLFGFYRFRNKLSIFFTYSMIATSIVGMYLIMDLKLPFENFTIFQRLDFFQQATGTHQSQGVNERISLYQTAWSQFINNPVLGDKIVVNYYNVYPHNVLLEILMSLGVVGGLLIFICLRRCILNIYLSTSNSVTMVPFSVILAAYLLLSLTSFSLFTLPGLWVMMAFVLTIVNRQR